MKGFFFFFFREREREREKEIPIDEKIKIPHILTHQVRVGTTFNSPLHLYFTAMPQCDHAK